MKVTEKCDVYSFGVVALEVIMGKHPGDVILSLSSSAGQNVLVTDVMDPRLPHPTTQVAEQVLIVVMTALASLSFDPKYRPTMQCICKILSESRSFSIEPTDTITLFQLMNLHYKFASTPERC